MPSQARPHVIPLTMIKDPVIQIGKPRPGAVRQHAQAGQLQIQTSALSSPPKIHTDVRHPLGGLVTS